MLLIVCVCLFFITYLGAGVGLVSSVDVMSWGLCVWALSYEMGLEYATTLLGGAIGKRCECIGLGWWRGCNMMRLVCVAKQPIAYVKGLG
jgi:hypothetical protein